MALNPTYDVINDAGISQSVIDRLLAIADEAFRLWSEVLAGDANLRVRVELVESTVSGRAQGGWGNGTVIGNVDGLPLVIGAPARELQTGQDVPNFDYDVIFAFSRDYLLNELFLDPSPQSRDDIPLDGSTG